MALPKKIDALGKSDNPKDWPLYMEELVRRRVNGMKDPSWSRLYECLIMMGIENPDMERDPKDVYADDWSTPEKLRAYNRRMWMILMKHPIILEELRKVALKDLKSQGIDAECGKLAVKSYGKLLLDNFLTKTPNPTWVG